MSKKNKQGMISYYPVISVFCTSSVSAQEKLSLLVVEIYEHVGIFANISPSHAISLTNKKEILNWFKCTLRSVFLSL